MTLAGHISLNPIRRSLARRTKLCHPLQARGSPRQDRCAKVREPRLQMVPDDGTETAGLATAFTILRPTQPIRLSLKRTQPLEPKETTMQYKTIVLELCNNGRRCTSSSQSRQLLPTMELYAQGTEDQPRSLEGDAAQAKPGSDPSQIASEAMEMALKELEDRLPSGSPPDGQEALSLDAAMAFIRRHTSRG